jgi:hypothetical protein
MGAMSDATILHDFLSSYVAPGCGIECACLATLQTLARYGLVLDVVARVGAGYSATVSYSSSLLRARGASEEQINVIVERLIRGRRAVEARTAPAPAVCPECNGSRVYVGLCVVEPCRACGGAR